jgi:hypothetical protein
VLRPRYLFVRPSNQTGRHQGFLEHCGLRRYTPKDQLPGDVICVGLPTGKRALGVNVKNMREQSGRQVNTAETPGNRAWLAGEHRGQALKANLFAKQFCLRAKRNQNTI